MRTWNWWAKGFILVPIEAGTKPLEDRPNWGEYALARVGDTIVWNDRVKTRIEVIRHYQSFKLMLAIEKPECFYPGASREVVLGALRSMYRTTPDKGVLCFELERIN